MQNNDELEIEPFGKSPVHKGIEWLVWYEEYLKEISQAFGVPPKLLEPSNTACTGPAQPSAWRAGGMCVCGHEGFVHSFNGSFPCDNCDCTVYVENGASQ